MSLEALTWAIQQEVFPSSRKFVLVMLANYASETGKTYPSVQKLARTTCLTEETVTACIDELVSSGMISDTGQRTGNTRRIRVFQLPSEAIGDHLNTQKNSVIKSPTNPREIPDQSPKFSDPPYIQGTGTGTICVRSRAFTPPTLDECVSAGKEIGMNSDQCEAFMDHFTSNGWKVSGKTAMKDWRAALRTWKRNIQRFSTETETTNANSQRNTQFNGNRPTPAEQRNAEITGAHLVAESIRERQANPKPSPWAANLARELSEKPAAA